MPNVRIQTTTPNVRVKFTRMVSGATTSIPAGTPIGLLLALTYATDQVNPGSETEGDSPNVRIITN